MAVPRLSHAVNGAATFVAASTVNDIALVFVKLNWKTPPPSTVTLFKYGGGNRQTCAIDSTKPLDPLRRPPEVRPRARRYRFCPAGSDSLPSCQPPLKRVALPSML